MENTQRFKYMLEKEKEMIEKELATVGRKNPDESEDWEATEPEMNTDTAEDGEVAYTIAQFENNRGIVTQLETQLGEVTAALKKVEEGTYGVCETCGEKIEEDRLEANASARTCKTHMNG